MTLYESIVAREATGRKNNDRILSAYDEILIESTHKNIIKKLKGDWKRVHGTGAAAKFGSWIKDAFETEADFLSAEIEVADQQTGKWKNFKNLKAAIKAFPELEKFEAGMRGSKNRIRFERSAKTRY